MKKLMIALLVVVCYSCSSSDDDNNSETFPEKIYEGNITLSSQIQVDEFGIENYTKINGNLTISRNFDLLNITSLESLKSLKFISNELKIINNVELTSLDGLDNIETIGFGLLISNNSQLETINLNKLNVVGGSVEIRNNENLTDLTHLNNLQTIGGNYLKILENSSLKNTNGLSGITSVDNLILDGPFLNLNGLNNITSVDLISIKNSKIINIDFLENISNNQISTITLINNSELKYIGGLQIFQTIFGLVLVNNDALLNLNGVNNVTGGLRIEDNDSLINLDGLNGVINLQGNLNILNNNSLENLIGLNNLVSVEPTIWIQFNNTLSSLEGLNDLSQAHGGIILSHNTQLRNFCALQTLITDSYNETFGAEGNYYNPTKQDIIDGNCSM